MRRLRLVFLVHCALAGYAAFASASELSGDFQLSSTVIRSGAPATASVTLDWQGSGVLDGSLRIAIQNGRGGETVCEVTDLALVRGRRQIRVMLPPLGEGVRSPEIKLTFLRSDGRELQIGSFREPETDSGREALVVCMSNASAGYSPESLRFWTQLRFEQFAPKNDSPAVSGYRTFPAVVPTDEMPVSANGYCSYDIVLLAGGGFSGMKEKQLAAVESWLRAGGSLMVAPDAQLKPYHEAFLRRIDPKVEERSDVGLGRCVVLRGNPDLADVRSDTAREAALFLWRFQRQTVHEIGERGTWRPGDSQGNQARQAFGAFRNGLSVLIPQEVRAIPFGVVLGILGAFVLCVGPLDYFLLGYLKRRPWTWAVFPCVSLAFTLLAVQVSEHYLGTEDHRNSMTFFDMDESGEVVRANRFEVVFASKPRRIDSEVRDSFVAPVWTQSSGQRTGNDLMRGRFPERYNLEFSVQQWKAECNRFLSIGVKAPHAIDWSAKRPTCANAEIEAAYQFSGPGHTKLFGGTALSPDMLSEASVASGAAASGYPGHRSRSSLVTAISPAGGSDFEDLPLYDPSDRDRSLLVAVIREGQDYFIYRKLTHEQ